MDWVLSASAELAEVEIAILESQDAPLVIGDAHLESVEIGPER